MLYLGNSINGSTKIREEPAIELVVSSVMERIVSTVEMGENGNIANVENSNK